MAERLTHFDEKGRPRMVDISAKEPTERAATASGQVSFSADGYDRVRASGVRKGDILSVAELAGIMGAKKTPDLIPLCHSLPLSSIAVTASFDDETQSVCISATVKTSGKTGVEMEALTAATVACLAVYDMAKSIDKAMTIGPIELVEKSGGASGDFKR